MVQLDPADRDALRACHKVHMAASATDDPHEPPMSLSVFGVWLASGWEGDPGEVWYVPGESPGESLAWYRLNLPDLKNKERAFLILVVHPTARRNGIGRQLLRHAADRAAANGRTVLGSVAVQDSAGAAFAMAVGAKAGLVEARRLLDLHKVPVSEFARLRERAAAAATGYTIVSWTGPTPEEYLSLVAAAFNAMNDAPSDEGWEEETWDADRVRDRANRIVRLTDVRGYSVAALHDATGELAALTQVEVDPERPDWGVPGAHGGDPPAPRAPAWPADQGHHDGVAHHRGTAGRAGRNRERRIQPAHDRGQRDPGLRAVPTRMAVLRDSGQVGVASCHCGGND